MEAISIDTSNWLMHYPTLRLVNHCRRLIHSEFGTRLHLSDPELRNTLAHYAGQSRSAGLQRIYAELRLALIELEGPDELPCPEEPGESGRPRRMYRGRPVAEPRANVRETGQETAPGAGSGRSRSIVYRGRTLQRD